MRRVLFSLLGTSLLGLAVGCCHTHGVCDCDIDDLCYTRQPYIFNPTVPVPVHGVVGHPVVAPVGEPLPPPKTRETPKDLPPVKGL